MTYRACKSLIDRKAYVSVDDMQTKLDIFMLNKRLTTAEYDELTGLLAAE